MDSKSRYSFIFGVTIVRRGIADLCIMEILVIGLVMQGITKGRVWMPWSNRMANCECWVP